MAQRRDEILQAALGCFLDKGVERTTLQDIRRASGASTGSIYHFFSGKDDLFGELLLESYAELNGAILAAVESATAAEVAVRALVKAYVAWVVAHPARARFLFRAPRDRMSPEHHALLVERNREFLRAMHAYVIERSNAGEIRAIPIDIFVAVILGPMQEYARQHIAGIAKSPPKRAIRELATAAWNAVRAT